MKKKWVSLLLTGVMTLSLAACGNQGTVTNNPTETGAASTEVEATASTSEEATEEAVVLVKPEEPAGQLIIGSTTDLSREFYDSAFDNTALY